jgi:acyl-CoA synthetase (AMP-forming)/AMP-acid ligase II
VSTYAGTEITFALNFDKDGQSYDSMKPNPEIPIRWEDVGHENPAVKELIVGPNPGLAVGIANLPGGWYATNDLFEELPLGSNSWVHIGRKDQMMIHSMGLNTPPEPIETFITSDTWVRSVLVVGHNRPLPGVVIEPDWSHIEGNDDDLKQYMWNLVERLNRSLPAHSRISQHTIYILPQGSELPRTDKNSIKRGLAATLYEKEIDQMYKNYEDAKALSG